MQKWEYQRVSASREWKGSIRGGWSNWVDDFDLHKMGEEGWELVSAYPVSNIQAQGFAGLTTMVNYVFKRPKEGG